MFPGGRRLVPGLLIAAAALLGGCGGPIKHDELARGVDTLAATAAEGALVAIEAAADRTK